VYETTLFKRATNKQKTCQKALKLLPAHIAHGHIYVRKAHSHKQNVSVNGQAESTLQSDPKEPPISSLQVVSNVKHQDDGLAPPGPTKITKKAVKRPPMSPFGAPKSVLELHSGHQNRSQNRHGESKQRKTVEHCRHPHAGAKKAPKRRSSDPQKTSKIVPIVASPAT